MGTLMKINDVSQKYKVTKRTLRYYEEIGLLKSIRLGASQSRYFDESAINRLEQVLLLRSVNFTIKEISSVLLSENPEKVFEVFIKRLSELDKRINELNYFKAVMEAFVKVGKSVGINNVNIYQLLKDQIYIQSINERMMNMEKRYDGDIIRLEFGMGIIPLISPKESSCLLGMIRDMRGKLESETDSRIPLIRVMDNGALDEWQYRISINGRILADNSLGLVPDAEKPAEIMRYLESLISSNIREISNAK